MCVSQEFYVIYGFLYTTAPTYFYIRLLRKVYNNTPAEVHVFIFYLQEQNNESLSGVLNSIILLYSVKLYLDQPPRLQERQTVFGLVNELLDLFAQFGQLLPDFEVSDDVLFVWYVNDMILLLQLLYSCTTTNPLL